MPMTADAMTTTEDDITQEARRRFEATPDLRLREIMLNLVRHLHVFVKDVQLTEAEWFEAIKFLTAIRQKCGDIRQEAAGLAIQARDLIQALLDNGSGAPSSVAVGAC